MKCPYCGEVDSKVIDSRPTEDGEKIRRRRECLNCKKRFTTYEIVETVPLMVVKPLVLEANTKVLAFVDMPLDPYFESSKLKDTTDGIYTDVFDGLSYDEYDPQEAAEILLDGVSSVLSANA